VIKQFGAYFSTRSGKKVSTKNRILIYTEYNRQLVYYSQKGNCTTKK